MFHGRPDQGNGRRVVVLGAGLAGLAASYNLMRSGFEVVVLERQDRPGGRVHTVRQPFVNDGYAELGALRIPDVHVYTNKYITSSVSSQTLRVHEQQQIRADLGVCTIPFPILRKLDIAGLAEQKMQAIMQYQLMTAARIYFQTRTAFWQDDPLGALGGLNMIGTDTVTERIWIPAPANPARNACCMPTCLASRVARGNLTPGLPQNGT